MVSKRKNLFIQFILSFIVYCVDLACHIGYYMEANKSRIVYEELFQTLKSSNLHLNRTVDFCTFKDFDIHEVSDIMNDYKRSLFAYLLFIIICSLILFVFILIFVYFIVQSFKNDHYLLESKSKILNIRMLFAGVLCFTQNIACSCLAVSLYADRSGPDGLVCWNCLHDDDCNTKRILHQRMSLPTTCLVSLMLCLIVISLWKGLTWFYRWSRTDKFDLWPIRGCVSIFVGFYFAVTVMTPSLGIFKYKHFKKLPDHSSNVFSQFTDSLFTIGIMGWIVFMIVGLCFPIVKAFRLGDPLKMIMGKNRLL